MKLTEKNRRIIALILAFILIAIGAVQIIFNLKFNYQIVRFAQIMIFFAGFYLLFISPKDSKNSKDVQDTPDFEASDGRDDGDHSEESEVLENFQDDQDNENE